MKATLFYFYFIPLLLIASCSTSHYNIDKHIGLYKIIEKNCVLSDGLYNPCQEMRFIELLKGTFYGIESDQTALVFWRAQSPDLDSGILAYEAKEIRNYDRIPLEGNKIFIANETHSSKNHDQEFDESEQEYFLITNSVLTDYYFILHRKNKKTGKTFSRNFHYKITPARWDDNESYKPLYPEDLEKE